MNISNLLSWLVVIFGSLATMANGVTWLAGKGDEHIGTLCILFAAVTINAAEDIFNPRLGYNFEKEEKDDSKN